eukprot:TRINITY_DN11949_c0_g1_i1.p1 TRINITY_DN11949_c0_g1~~TRINITY_DN11949_c0_g1_i1.p1  ORF type:complete len:233 (-),score=28.72 TRINITY_DN11949_c0_g1_i1:48-746(-)
MKIIEVSNHGNTNPNKQQSSGFFAKEFPRDMKILEHTRSSSLNPNLSSGLFIKGGKHMEADKHAGLVLREMGWENWSLEMRKEYCLLWVEKVLHPLDDILFDISNSEVSVCFSHRLHPLKPTFSAPTVIAHKKHSFDYIYKKKYLSVLYWTYDEAFIVRYNCVDFNEKGDIIARSILTSSSHQLLFGASKVIFSSIFTVALITYCKWNSLNALRQSIMVFINYGLRLPRKSS